MAPPMAERHWGTSSAMTTSAAVMNFMSFGFRPTSSAAKMIRR